MKIQARISRAVADYLGGGGSIVKVAARHGISSSALHRNVQAAKIRQEGAAPPAAPAPVQVPAAPSSPPVKTVTATASDVVVLGPIPSTAAGVDAAAAILGGGPSPAGPGNPPAPGAGELPRLASAAPSAAAAPGKAPPPPQLSPSEREEFVMARLSLVKATAAWAMCKRWGIPDEEAGKVAPLSPGFRDEARRNADWLYPYFEAVSGPWAFGVAAVVEVVGMVTALKELRQQQPAPAAPAAPPPPPVQAAPAPMQQPAPAAARPARELLADPLAELKAGMVYDV